jgi:hypothetical protein
MVLAALIVCGCSTAPRAPHTPYSAGVAASRLANEACQERYGERPFRHDDFEAVLREGRWTWGGPDGRPVDGYSATVSFAPDGTGAEVEVGRDGEED